MQYETNSEPNLKELIAAWLNEAHEMDSGDTWTNRRRSLRFYWTAPIDVHADSGPRHEKTLIATGRDISENGIGIRTRQEVPKGATVLVCRGGDSDGVPGRVTACTQTIGGYLVGIQFDFDDDEAS